MADLPERLREAADAHRPDRERMLARVERAMSAPPTVPRQREAGRGGAPWMRVTAVTAAVAGAIGLGGLAVGAVTGDGEPARNVVTSDGPSHGQPPSAAPEKSGSPATHKAPTHRSTHPPGHHNAAGGHTATPPAGPPPSPSTSTTTPPAGPGAGGTPQSDPPASSGTLSARGSLNDSSNAYWTQSDVALTNSQPLTALTVELRVARTEGVSSTGSWTSVSGQTTASVTVEGAELVYRWTLNSGQTLVPGTHTFSGQFNHAEGDRDVGGDGYTAASEGPDGASSVTGGF